MTQTKRIPTLALLKAYLAKVFKGDFIIVRIDDDRGGQGGFIVTTTKEEK